jgi:Xaa-Pro aminopeptidase
VACATGRPGGARLRRYPADVPIEPGQLVALSPAAFFGGYEGGLARTVVVGASTGASPDADQSALLGRCRDSLHAIVAACRPGATGAEVVRAGGPAASAEPVLTGIGLGVEPPVIGRGLGAGAVLEAGTVVRVQAWVTSPVAGGALESDTVLVSDDGPVVLSRYR